MPVGESFEVSSDSEYGDVIVNGSLTVKPGVTLTVTNFYVGQVADDAEQPTTPASVEVQAGASVVMANWSASDNKNNFVVGDGGPATFTLQEGATLQASRLNLGGSTTNRNVAVTPDVHVRVVLNNARVEIKNNIYTAARSSDAANEVVRVELNGSDTLLTCQYVRVWGKKAQTCFAFAGGMVKFNQWYNYDQSGRFDMPYVDGDWNAQSLALESVDGHPIHFWVGNKNPIFELHTSGSSWIVLRGEGPFLLEGNSSRPLFQYKSQGTLKFENAGGLVVSSGVTLQGGNAFSASQLANAPKVRVAHGGKIDLNGFDLALDALEAAGAVTNSSATAATLTVGKNGGDVLFAVPPPAADLPIVKTGAGTLRMPDGTLESLTVSSGTVEFLNRRDVGFPYYRLFVDGRSGGFRINEVAFLDGEDDVTGEWTAISRSKNGGFDWGAPTGAVDRVDTTHWGEYSRDGKWGSKDVRTNRTFFVTHFGGAPSLPFNWFTKLSDADYYTAEAWTNAAAPLVPASFCRTLTGYRLKTNDSTNLPVDWRVSGGFADSFTANDWQDLDVVRDATHPGALAWTETRTFAYTNAAVSVGSLTLADGATWELDVGQGRLTLESLALGGGGTLVLRNFARVSDLRTLPVAVGSCETAANLEKWTVTCEGREDKKRRLVLRDGVLCTESTLGSLFLVR